MTCRSLVQRSPDECVVSLSVISKPDLGLSVLRSVERLLSQAVLQSFRPSSLFWCLPLSDMPVSAVEHS